MKKSFFVGGTSLLFLLFWLAMHSHSPREAVLERFHLEEKQNNPEVSLVAEQIVIVNRALSLLLNEEKPEAFDRCRQILSISLPAAGEDKRLAAMKRHLAQLMVDQIYVEKEYVFPYETRARDQLLFGLREFFPVDAKDWDRAPLWVTANPRYVEILRAKKNRLWPRENYEIRSLAE